MPRREPQETREPKARRLADPPRWPHPISLVHLPCKGVFTWFHARFYPSAGADPTRVHVDLSACGPGGLRDLYVMANSTAAYA